MFTSLNQINYYLVHKYKINRLLRSLNKIKCDDEKLALSVLYKSIGFEDTIFHFRHIQGYNKELIKLSFLFALSVKDYWDMPAITEKYLKNPDENIKEEAKKEAFAATNKCVDYDSPAASCRSAFFVANADTADTAFSHAARSAYSAGKKYDIYQKGEKQEKILLNFLKTTESENYIMEN